MALKCKKTGDDWLVDLGDFRLRFSKSRMGISSFSYLKGGDWHEVVNSAGSLYFPRLSSPGLTGVQIYPYSGDDIEAQNTGKTFAHICFTGFLSNAIMGAGYEEFPFAIRYSIHEDGDIHLKSTIIDNMSSQEIFTEEHLLNPKDDGDITLGRDTAPNLWFAGFHSNNTGNAASDLSHDGILIQVGDIFDSYVTYTSGDDNAAGLSRGPTVWQPQDIVSRCFRLHLSADGSPNDVTNSAGFQSVGDDKGADFRNPDPLTGGPDEGEVLIGLRAGDGYDEGEGTYTVATA